MWSSRTSTLSSKSTIKPYFKNSLIFFLPLLKQTNSTKHLFFPQVSIFSIFYFCFSFSKSPCFTNHLPLPFLWPICLQWLASPLTVTSHLIISHNASSHSHDFHFQYSSHIVAKLQEIGQFHNYLQQSI